MRIAFVSVLAIVGLLCTSPQRAASQDTSAASTVEVRLNYTGSGAVDEKHKIYVVLWDSPAFATGEHVKPVEIQPYTAKRGSVTFSNVKKVPAYVSAAFDPKGEWDGQSGPPPDGSSLGLYSKTPGEPAPVDIKPGKSTSIEISFDDTVKMQGGKPTK